MVDATECTVKGLVANKMERAVMAILNAVTQCAAIWYILLMQWNELWRPSLST